VSAADDRLGKVPGDTVEYKYAGFQSYTLKETLSLCDHWYRRSRFKTQHLLETLSVHPAVNEYPTLFRAGEGEGHGEEEWRPTSATPLPV